ncbi:MAG: hypothetical protein JJU05_12705 [Verrucomicrobia bacterium]|nr:hypothetical protein [Verrucomicrobiota bacterium]MCH8528370.1 hypothetical protein [Kiritimatiellia bacterium]
MNSLQEAIRCVDRIQRELKIPCLLIGGFAVNEYGYSRNTLDIKDILPLCERYGNPDIAEKIQIELGNLQS